MYYYQDFNTNTANTLPQVTDEYIELFCKNIYNLRVVTCSSIADEYQCTRQGIEEVEPKNGVSNAQSVSGLREEYVNVNQDPFTDAAQVFTRV